MGLEFRFNLQGGKYFIKNQLLGKPEIVANQQNWAELDEMGFKFILPYVRFVTKFVEFQVDKLPRCVSFGYVRLRVIFGLTYVCISSN